MAVNKRKILEAAQKYLQKGALDRALKEYRTLLELDPRDGSARLKLGDIHLRLGEKGEAVAAYLKVAHQFMKEGFDAKAVALFKQITKLAPEQIEVYVPLAELYQRLGLIAEAMSALQTATEGFQNAGRKREALELLRKAAALDPANTTSRLKIADLLRQQGMTAEALTEYDEVAEELARGGETEALASVYERALEIEPDRLPTLLALARLWLTSRTPERARALAERSVAAHPDLIEALELHAETLQTLGLGADETEPVFRRLAEAHRARGNEDRAREILQRFLPAYDLTLNGVDDLGVDLPASSLPRCEPPGEAMEVSEPCAGSVPTGEEAAPALSGTPPVEADSEQLLAEAGVYLRFGKREKAIASLEAVLAREPEHDAALEKLAGALAHDGDVARAAELFGRAAAAARARGDEAAAARFVARLGEIDPVAAQPFGSIGPDLDEALAGSAFEPDGRHALAGPAPVAPVAEVIATVSEPESETEFEFEVDLDLSGESEPIELAAGEVLEAPEVPSSREAEIELGPDVELGSETGLGEQAVPIVSEPAPEWQLEAEPETVSSEPSPTLEADGAKTPSLAASPKQILEDLEEADFYVQQGLLVEAEAVYRRVLEVAPTNPQALLRLGEIAAARGCDPGAEQGFESAGSAVEQVPPISLQGDDGNALGDDLADWDDFAAAPAQAGGTPSFEVPPDVDPLPCVDPDDSLEALLAPAAERLVTDGAESPSGGVETREPSHFDLAAELSDALGLEATAVASPPEPAPATEESLEAIFREFKQGVRKTLTAADHETHYDLGIAYREMGLLEDALGEFQIALASPARRLDCLHLLGVCARELKRPHDAIAFLQQALSEADLPIERRAAFGFDLGLAIEESGDSAAALAVFEEVAAVEPEFPGLGQRIDALRALLTLTPSDAVAVPAASPVEIYESFDDLIAHAEAEVVTSGGAAVAEPPDGDPAPSPPRGNAPRRRKISFG